MLCLKKEIVRKNGKQNKEKFEKQEKKFEKTRKNKKRKQKTKKIENQNFSFHKIFIFVRQNIVFESLD